MNFYEVNEPYYALVMADSYEKAYKEYVEVVAEDHDGDLLENINQVSEQYALLRFSRVTDDGGDLLEIDEMLRILKSEKTELLIIDGSLI